MYVCVCLCVGVRMHELFSVYVSLSLCMMYVCVYLHAYMCNNDFFALFIKKSFLVSASTLYMIIQMQTPNRKAVSEICLACCKEVIMHSV